MEFDKTHVQIFSPNNETAAPLGMKPIQGVVRQQSALNNWQQFNASNQRRTIAPHTLTDDSLAEQCRQNRILLPDGLVRKTWDHAVALLCLWITFIVPLEFGILNLFTLRLPWGEFRTDDFEVNNFDYVTWGVFCCDFLVQSSTAYVTEDGHLAVNRAEIFRNYRKSGILFWIDACACVPVFALNISWFWLIKLPCLERFMDTNELWDRLVNGEKGWILRVAKLFLILLTLIHIFSCMWAAAVDRGDNYGVSQESWYRSYHSGPVWGHNVNSWIDIHDTDVEKYMACVYVSIHMFFGGEGYPTTALEFFLASLCSLMGVIFQGLILAEITSILNNARMTSMSRMTKMDSLNTAMHFSKIPERVRERVRKYYEYCYMLSGVSDNSHAWIDELSAALQMDLKCCIYYDLIGSCPLFERTHPDFIAEIIVCLHNRMFLPGECILRYGSRGEEMFFIVKGVARCLGAGGSEICTLGAGRFFGEVALLKSGCTRTATVMSATYSDLRVLTKRDFRHILARFPEEGRDIRRAAQRRLTTHEIAARCSPREAKDDGEKKKKGVWQLAFRDWRRVSVKRMEDAASVVVQGKHVSGNREALDALAIRIQSLNMQMRTLQSRWYDGVDGAKRSLDWLHCELTAGGGPAAAAELKKVALSSSLSSSEVSPP